MITAEENAANATQMYTLFQTLESTLLALIHFAPTGPFAARIAVFLVRIGKVHFIRIELVGYGRRSTSPGCHRITWKMIKILRHYLCKAIKPVIINQCLGVM